MSENKSNELPGPWELYSDGETLQIRMGTAIGGSGSWEPHHKITMDIEDLDDEQLEEAQYTMSLIVCAPQMVNLLRSIVKMNGVGYKNPALFVNHLQDLIKEADKLVSIATGEKRVYSDSLSDITPVENTDEHLYERRLDGSVMGLDVVRLKLPESVRGDYDYMASMLLYLNDADQYAMHYNKIIDKYSGYIIDYTVD